MGFLQRIFGSGGAKPKSVAARASQPAVSAHSPSTRGSANSPQAIRKELVRVSARDTLLHNGIPADWVRADPLTTAAPGRDPGVHVRLSVLHWDPRLVVHAVALQQNLEKRILMMDPQASQWLMGLSWQFALKDDSVCPPLPHPGSWTAPAPDPAAAAPDTEPGNADVISGPTRIAGGGAPHSARAELERMLGERDASFRKDGGSSFEATQPMKL
ncbi:MULTISPECIES: hypothetical protein [Ramlibacter]|uniref:Uncharacterized protein n=1 Tax=Ramlibacter pinisoli TaxID=2682844 RepID=A0A6N8IRZ8_9BURK|nr:MULTISPECIES: hypothetical protein [Ramlibacter]MBA2963687.1 hypothetical protein [Ramlibacter sp. CGMCC 1.13660]MVQ28653.1 hypothetical protein [Ramlibacter pinisoli]